jgi:drug/metabolite transporter (DMT)-like permease
MLSWFLTAEFLGPLAALMTSVTWAIGGMAYTQLYQHYPASVINFNRALFALPFFIILFIYHYPEVHHDLMLMDEKIIFQKIFYLSVSIVFSYACADIFFYKSASLVGLPVAQSLGALYPLWTALAGVLIFQEELTPIMGFGFLLTLLGIILILLKLQPEQLNQVKEIKQGEERTKGFKSFLPGIIWGLLTSLFWGMNSLFTNLGGKNFPFYFGSLVRTSSGFMICLTLSLILLKGNFKGLFFSKSHYKKFWPAILFESVVGAFVYLYGLGQTSMTLGPILSSLAPVFAIPLSIYYGHEKLSFKSILGVFMILGGLWALIH